MFTAPGVGSNMMTGIQSNATPVASPAPMPTSYGAGAFGAEQLLMGNAFQHPFVPQDLWQMPMTLEWDWSDLSQPYGVETGLDPSFAVSGVMPGPTGPANGTGDQRMGR